MAQWRPRTVSAACARFARSAVARVAPHDGARAKALLWSCAKLAAFAESLGYSLDDELFCQTTIERFIASGTATFAPASVRTLRTNLRAVADGLAALGAPVPAALARSRAKAPYTSSEIARYLALADAQPTEARRQRANGILGLGAGAGLTGIDLRAVAGHDVVERPGGLLVIVRSGRPRVVPVLARFAPRVCRAATFAGSGFIVGGVEPHRRNVTSALIASLSGGADLPRLELPRLRATWLASVAELIGLPTFMAAAGITCSQHLGDVVATLAPGGQDEAMALLGGRL